jgi:chemotaxis protein methyltransferase CheR
MTSGIREGDCVELLQSVLPKLGLRWAAISRNRRQVCRRLKARIRSLGLPDPRAYAEYAERHPDEWAALEAMCSITISRFYRDRAVFDPLARDVLATLACELPIGSPLRVWSAGCASGEEPYSIALIWELEVAARYPGRELQILATDRDPRLLERAAIGCYRRSSLRELPASWVERAFTNDGDCWCLDQTLRRCVTFQCQDLRQTLPDGPFDLILCRNLAFSYFEVAEQRALLARLIDRLGANRFLVLGLDEVLPDEAGFERLPQSELIWRRVTAR